MTVAGGADTLNRFDFRKPCALAAEVEQRLRIWQESTTRRTNQRWEQLLPVPLVWTLDRIQPRHPATLQYESPVVAFDMVVNQTPGGVALVVPRALALTVVHDLLEQEVPELSPDKSLTALEETMLRYVCESFAEGCNETQPMTPHCQLDAFHAKPDLERMFPDAGDVVVIRFEMEGPFGRQTNRLDLARGNGHHALLLAGRHGTLRGIGRVPRADRPRDSFRVGRATRFHTNEDLPVE